MIAKDVYKILKAVVGPWFKQNGFKLLKSSYLTYQKVVEDRYFIVRFQCNSDGWERYKGSSFTVFLQLDATAEFSYTSNRLTMLLTLPELELIRARQNRVISAIPPPPPEYVEQMRIGFAKVFRDPAPYFELFLRGWQLQKVPFCSSDDIWFRYFTEDDVKSWAILTLNHIRTHHKRLLAKAAA